MAATQAKAAAATTTPSSASAADGAAAQLVATAAATSAAQQPRPSLRTNLPTTSSHTTPPPATRPTDRRTPTTTTTQTNRWRSSAEAVPISDTAAAAAAITNYKAQASTTQNHQQHRNHRHQRNFARNSNTHGSKPPRRKQRICPSPATLALQLGHDPTEQSRHLDRLQRHTQSPFDDDFLDHLVMETDEHAVNHATAAATAQATTSHRQHHQPNHMNKPDTLQHSVMRGQERLIQFTEAFDEECTLIREQHFQMQHIDRLQRQTRNAFEDLYHEEFIAPIIRNSNRQQQQRGTLSQEGHEDQELQQEENPEIIHMRLLQHLAAYDQQCEERRERRDKQRQEAEIMDHLQDQDAVRTLEQYLLEERASAQLMLDKARQEFQRRNQELQTLADKAKCIVCYERERSAVMLPCNHLFACWECIAKIRANAPTFPYNIIKCSICRTPCDRVISIKNC